jgi:hypothetical protein
LRSGGSEVVLGNLLTLPVGNGLLYIEPVYTQAKKEPKFPLLNSVIVAFGDQVAYQPTLRQALDALAAGARSPHEVFLATQRAEEAAFLGDTWLWERLYDLGQGDRRLVQTSAGDPVGPPPPRPGSDGFTAVELELTDTGRAVLAGEADRAALVPLDRWVGGIRLRGPEPAWRFDRARGRAVGA